MAEKKKYPTLLRLRSIAITETLVAILALLVINLFFFNGDRFAGINPHPFWFVVILISAQYGVAEGVFAVIVASLAFLIGNVRPEAPGEYFYSYLLDVGSQPLMWLLSAVILGSLRFRHVTERDRLRKEIEDAMQREELVAKHYEQLRAIKEMLEQRLVRQAHTTVDMYKAARLMETSQPGKILEGVQGLIQPLLLPKKFSVFLLNGDTLEASMKYAWERPDEFHTVILSNQKLFEEIVTHKRILCITDIEDELALAGQGMLAGPIMSDSGQILGMLKIEEIDYTDLHVSTIETFRIVCAWIGNAYFHAKNYQLAASHSYIAPENNLYSYEFFKLQSDYTTFLARRFKFDLSLIVVQFLNTADMPPAQYAKALEALSGAVAARLRKIDQIFNYRMANNSYYILLPGAGQRDTPVVIDKITQAFNAAQKAAGTQLKLSFSVQTLYENKNSRVDA